VQDLNGKYGNQYGNPTVRYVGAALMIKVNGSGLVPPSMTQHRKNVYCILDTGCSGMFVSPCLFNARYNAARANKEKGLWGMVDVKFVLLLGDIVPLSVKHPITTSLGNN
jgi:hypothetical protein